MIYKGLNQEDAEFLGMVSQKQAEIDDKRYNEESEEIQNYRASVLFLIVTIIVIIVIPLKQRVTITGRIRDGLFLGQ
jgi:N-terminal domain of NEFA-interacting nuclear protein NIP30.